MMACCSACGDDCVSKSEYAVKNRPKFSVLCIFSDIWDITWSAAI